MGIEQKLPGEFEPFNLEGLSHEEERMLLSKDPEIVALFEYIENAENGTYRKEVRSDGMIEIKDEKGERVLMADPEEYEKKRRLMEKRVVLRETGFHLNKSKKG